MKNIIKRIKKEQVIYTIILFLVFLAIMFSMAKDRKKLLFYNKTYVQDTPIMVKKNNNIGYISPYNGKFVIKPRYSYGERFYGDYAIVKIKKKNTEYYRIIDKNNVKKIEFETYLNYEYIKEYNRWLIDGVLYDNNFSPYYNKDYYIEYISNGLFTYKNKITKEVGIINYLNKKLFKFKGVKIDVDKNNISKNNIVVKTDDYIYLCDIKSKKIIHKVKSSDYIMELVDDNIIKLISNNNDITYLVFKNSNIIYETSDSIEGLELKDNYLVIDYGFNYFENNKKQRFYYYNLNTEELSKKEPVFKKNNKNEYGYELINKDGKSGLKKDGAVILNASYKEIKFIQYDLYDYINHIYNQELVLLYSNSKVELYNLKNNKVIETFNINSRDYLQPIENTPYIKIKLYSNNNSVILYNIITKKSMEFENYNSYFVDTNYVIIKTDNKMVYYNCDFLKIYEIKL